MVLDAERSVPVCFTPDPMESPPDWLMWVRAVTSTSDRQEIICFRFSQRLGGEGHFGHCSARGLSGGSFSRNKIMRILTNWQGCFCFVFSFFFCLVPLSSPWIYGELCHALLATEHLQQLFESAEYLDDVMFELDKGDGGGGGGERHTKLTV